jgi:hypothetical protein
VAQALDMFPTGDEWRRPVHLEATSATERAAFRRCRRQWFLTIVHRLQTQEDNLNFWIGELVHTGLEAYYRGLLAGADLETAETAGLDAYQDAFDVALEKARSGPMGIIWGEAEPMYRDLGEMGWGMLEGYFERERQFPIGDEVVEVEVRRFVPIVDSDGNEVGRLSVRTDLVVRRRGLLAVVDHKTATQHLNSAMLDLDDQLTAEVYIVWKELGEFPAEAVYNSLAKKLPVPPAQLKPTKKEPVAFSRSKTQPTTAALYRATLAEAGLDEADYADILAILDEREATDQSPFFFREATFRTPGQMASFEANLFQEFRDMQEVAADPARAYPNPSTFACPSCPVKAICMVMMDGGDPATIITNEYTLAEPRY